MHKPRLFRLNLEVGDIAHASTFYATLLGSEARMDRGSRCHVDAGGVSLQIVQVPEPHPAAKALAFVTSELDVLHGRAAQLGCLSGDPVHGARGGDIAVRPWGERSFYCDDPWGNPLCFVAEGTLYTP